MKTNPRIIALALLSLVYVVWASAFIYRSSFIGIDGVRYFSLFDDAMISMRYAWHLSHGYGLVWNIGERVEGFTNPLWTLWMSLGTWIFDKRIAVLFIHISGVFIMLGIASLTYAIATRLAHERDPSGNSWAPLIAFILVLLYYPLSFWTLMGMETGLLSFLLLASVLIVLRSGHDFKISGLLLAIFCLAILTRPDALIYVVLILSHRFYVLLFSKNLTQQHIKTFNTYRLVAIEVVLLVLIVALPVVLRWFYYGELVPNTYTLKMTGMPVIDRLANGIGFIAPFFITIIPIIIFLMFNIRLLKTRNNILLLGLVITSISYQVWVGGDPWTYWRTMAPVMPLLFILCIEAMFNIAHHRTKSGSLNSRPARYVTIIFGGSLLVYVFANYKMLSEQYLIKPAYNSDASQSFVNVAIATNEILIKDATLAVFASGALPYFANFKAIDILGKSDKRIAHLPPDMSGAIAWSGMKSVPGHNKYDLRYSIVDLKPTYVQNFKIGRDDFTEYAHQNYARVHYKEVGLWLLADSKDVLWDKIKNYEHRPIMSLH